MHRMNCFHCLCSHNNIFRHVRTSGCIGMHRNQRWVYFSHSNEIFWDALIPEICARVVKVNIFWDNLSDVSARTKHCSSVLCCSTTVRTCWVIDVYCTVTVKALPNDLLLLTDTQQTHRFKNSAGSFINESTVLVSTLRAARTSFHNILHVRLDTPDRSGVRKVSGLSYIPVYNCTVQSTSRVPSPENRQVCREFRFIGVRCINTYLYIFGG